MSRALHLDEAIHRAIREQLALGCIYLDSANIEEVAGDAIRVRAYFGRAGMVLEYTDADPGGARLDLVDDSALFGEESVATLRDISVSVYHPVERELNKDNWRGEVVGHIAADIARDGEYLAGWVIINDAQTISRVRNRQLCELSPGYDAESVDETGTTPDGRAFTRRQIRRVYNHMALLPPNAGRSGRDIALRLDHQKGSPTNMTIKKNDSGAPDDEKDKEKPFTDAQTKAMTDMFSAMIGDALAKLTPAKNDSAQPSPKEAPTPTNDAATIEARINDSVDIRDKARRVLGDTYSFVGKANRQVMVDVVKHTDATFDPQGLSDDRVRGEFEGAVRLAAAKRASANDGEHLLPFENVNDGEGEPEPNISDRIENAWRDAK